MTGRKYVFNYSKKKWGKTWFLLAILMAALDAQQNFRQMKYFFLSISGRSKVIAFFDEKFAKVKHTICDIQINQNLFSSF